MTTSAEMPDEIWASNLGGWWSHVTNAATTRYIRADLHDAQAAEIERLKADRERLDSILCGCVTIHRSPSGNFTARGVGGNFVHGTVAHESDADYLVACKAAIDESMGQQP